MVAGETLRRRSARAAPAAALLLLCLLWACSVLRVDLLTGLTSSLPSLERQAIALALFAAAAGMIASIRMIRRSQWPSGRQFWVPVLIGFGLFVVPAVLVQVAVGWVTPLSRAALFTLVPLFAVVFEPYLGESAERQLRAGRGSLLAALAAVVGAMCVFPVQIPQSVEAGAAFCAVILATACVAWTNCRAVPAAADLPEDSIAAFAAVGSGAAALGLGVASLLLERVVWNRQAIALELFWSVAVEAPALWLLFWLMPRMSAARMATRYVLAPLLAILIGMGLLRSGGEIRAQTWLGLGLMAAGAGRLLFASATGDDSKALSLQG